MAKHYNLKQQSVILHHMISNSLQHIYDVEKQIASLNLKMDGSDSVEDMKKARIFTILLTIINDILHPAHGFCASICEKSVIERFVKNQKIAFEQSLVNPCVCIDCIKKGYKDATWNASRQVRHGNENVSGSSSDSQKSSDSSASSESTDSSSIQN